MRLPPEDMTQIASAIKSLSEEHGEAGMTMTDISTRAGLHHRKVKFFMGRYGPDSTNGANYWKKVGRKFALTTTGQIMFENLSASATPSRPPLQDSFADIAERFPSTDGNGFRTEAMNEFIDFMMDQIEQYCVEKDAKNEEKQSLIRRLINRLTKD